MQIVVYKNNKFESINEVYESKLSENLTFYNDDQIFKIEMSNESKKRKRSEEFQEENENLLKENEKLLKENGELKEKMSRILAITNMVVNKLKYKRKESTKINTILND